MAKSSEYKMLFDLRGRRKRVVQVVYAFLAVLLALSLLTVVGPFSIGDVFSGGGGGDPSSTLDDQAEAIEKRLARNPENEDLLLALVRTRYSAGNTLIQVDPTTGQQSISTDAVQEYEQAADAWSRYLRLDPAEPNPNTALQAANALFTLAQTASTGAQAESYLEDAAAAQAIVAEARPNVGTLSTLAYYSYAALDFEAGDEAARKAEQAAASKAERTQVRTQLATIRKQAKRFEKQQQAAAQRGGEQQAQEQLGSPLGGGGLGAPVTP
jgi:tetratricopeptide (TPR) repeat protein